MAIARDDWDAIYSAIKKGFSEYAPEVTFDKVIKRDPDNKLIWTRQFGPQPIPLFAFKYKVVYYDNAVANVGNPDIGEVIYRKEAFTEVCTPEIGETVLILKQFGSLAHPRCVGVLQSPSLKPLV